MKDRDPLSSALQSWRHEPAPAPDFGPGVWQRIHATGTAPAPAGRILRFPIALPLAASFAVILAGVIGTSTALALTRAQTTDRMASAYVRTIDPLLMTGHSAHP